MWPSRVSIDVTAGSIKLFEVVNSQILILHQFILWGWRPVVIVTESPKFTAKPSQVLPQLSDVGANGVFQFPHLRLQSI